MISDSEHVCNAIFTGKAAHKVKVPPPQKMSRSMYYERLHSPFALDAPIQRAI
jgi:hypothetical protein